MSTVVWKSLGTWPSCWPSGNPLADLFWFQARAKGDCEPVHFKGLQLQPSRHNELGFLFSYYVERSSMIFCASIVSAMFCFAKAVRGGLGCVCWGRWWDPNTFRNFLTKTVQLLCHTRWTNVFAAHNQVSVVRACIWNHVSSSLKSGCDVVCLVIEGVNFFPTKTIS